MSDPYKEFQDDPEGDEEEPQHPDTLLKKTLGEHAGQEVFQQDFAAWEFEHRACPLDFSPLFIVVPEKSRIPEYLGMLITCHTHREQFRRSP